MSAESVTPSRIGMRTSKRIATESPLGTPCAGCRAIANKDGRNGRNDTMYGLRWWRLTPNEANAASTAGVDGEAGHALAVSGERHCRRTQASGVRVPPVAQR